ncbi:MAG: helix-turn-helix domain-containing protein [Clostridia bacterium]|nr:helix-turn-helix domain-containing protein [Clostridia bacterium]
MTVENNMSMANKLRKLRKDFCMTQDQIADILGMSRTSFSKYENGAANPPLNVLRKISAIYNVPIEYLIHDEQNKPFLNSDPDADDSADESAKYFTQLTDEEKMLILRFRLLSKEDKDDFLRPLNTED